MPENGYESYCEKFLFWVGNSVVYLINVVTTI